jgi:HD-GYP domain-containing protein (c-di-GMP phosphodiesterase class II)
LIRTSATGDAVLTEVAARVTGSCREEDLKARIGGEEFALVLSGAGTALAREVAERALDAIRQEAFGLAGELTASAGVAAFPEHAAGKADLLLRAERAVRVAKSRGKDSVVVWEPHLQATDLDAVSREGQMRAMFALARAVDTRDPYTGMHSQRLARYAKAIAEGLGIRDDRLAIIRASALLHDVGKIGVRDAVLLKPAALDEAEFAEMREHPVLGERIVVGAVDRQISRAIRHHHERVDGTGYPDGLKGDAIPLPSRILLVADAFDAMTSDRIYRKALPLGKAVDELKKYAGTQFDSDIVRMAVSLIESGVIGVLD